MAKAKDTFTDKDEEQLRELMARRDRIRTAEADAQRAEEAKAFKALDPLFEALDMSKVKPAIADALKAEGLSQPNRDRLSRISQILHFDYVNGLLAERDRLNPPPADV